MSDGVAAPSASSTTSNTTQAPAQGATAQTRTPDQASQALTDRVQARRLEAERQGGFLENKRGPDGKFQSTKADDGAHVDEKKTGNAPAGQPEKPAEKKPEAPKADPEHEKLKGEHESLKAKYDESEKKNTSWEELGEKALARIDAYKARVAYLEQKLQEAGAQPDPGVLENLSLKEKIRARELADERAAARAQAEAETEKGRAREAERGELTGAFKRIWDTHPELRPPFTTETAEAGAFWQGIQQAIQGGANFAALAPILASAPALAASIKAKRGAARATSVAPPRILTSSAQPGGEPRVIDRHSIVEKHKARLRAG